MKKADFIQLILGAIGGILFALGMCMCLVSEWNTFTTGLIMGAAGLIVLLAIPLARRRMQGKPAFRLSKKAAAAIALGTIGTLCFGTGLCMTMVWKGMMVWGILLGIAGIFLLLCLIPLCRGLK